MVDAGKPDSRIFERALDLIGVPRERVVHAGNDPVPDVERTVGSGIDTVFTDRKGYQVPGWSLKCPMWLVCYGS